MTSQTVALGDARDRHDPIEMPISAYSAFWELSSDFETPYSPTDAVECLKAGLISADRQMVTEVIDAGHAARMTGRAVLVTGPTGSGKEIVARAVAILARRSPPFRAINCGAIPASLIEAELFGTVKGAFSDATDRAGVFEQADGGTVFLDEIGEMPKDLQVRLLRVLQERTVTRMGDDRSRKVDVLVLAATNRHLDGMVESGAFREDLFRRLNAVRVTLWALRDRMADQCLLLWYFLKRWNHNHPEAEITQVSTQVIFDLLTYSWPGSVGELEEALEVAVSLQSEDTTLLGLNRTFKHYATGMPERLGRQDILLSEMPTSFGPLVRQWEQLMKCPPWSPRGRELEDGARRFLLEQERRMGSHRPRTLDVDDEPVDTYPETSHDPGAGSLSPDRAAFRKDFFEFLTAHKTQIPSREELDCHLREWALRTCGANVAAAARLIRISPTTMYKFVSKKQQS